MSQLNHLKKLFLTTAAITGLSLGSAHAQITYTQGWETAGLNSWTTYSSAGAFDRTTLVPCTGGGAVRANIYYGGNSVLQSPALTGNNGGDITVSFNYKLVDYYDNTLGATDINTILVQWTTNPTAGPWTNAGIIDASGHTVSASCANKSFTIVNVPATGNIYIRLAAISGSSSDNYIYFDDVNISQQSNQSCWAPSNPTIGLVTDNSAGLSWTAPSTAPSQGYEYYFSTSSTAPTATTTPSGTAPAGTTTTTMSPMLNNTVYYAWIRSSCGSSKSGWNMINPFITEKLTPRPWTEDCSDINTFDRWEAQAGSWFLGTTSGMTGNPGDLLYVNQFSAATDTASISSHNIGPVLAADSFRFDYKVANYSSPYGSVSSGAGYLKVLISTDFGQSYTQLDSLPHPTSTAWITKAYSLANFAGQKVKVKVAAYWNSSVAADYNIGFDNFFIGSSCTPPVVNLGADTTICQGTTLTLNAGNTTGATYAWSNGASTQTLAVTTAGTYYVTVTQGACITSDTIVVNTSTPPTVALGADTTLCDVNTFTLDAGAGTGYTYLWNNNVTNQVLDVTTSGTYSVTVTNAQGCTATDDIIVTFSTAPTATGITATGNPSPTFNFEANGAANVTSYHWDFGHEGNTATGATATYTYPSLASLANYTVTLTISNDCGDVVITTVVTVNPVSINDLGLDNNALKLFPNPGSHTVKLINESNYKMKQIIVSNILGQTVTTIPVRNNNQQLIDVNNLPAGLYNVRIEFETGTVIRKLEVIK